MFPEGVAEDAQSRLLPVSESHEFPAMNASVVKCPELLAGERHARLWRGPDQLCTEETLPERTPGGFPLARHLHLHDVKTR